MTGFVAPTLPVVAAATNEDVTGWIDSHVPPGVTWTTNELSYYLSAAEKIKSAWKTVAKDGKDITTVDYVALVVDIISVLGLTSGSSSNVGQQLQQVLVAVEQEYAGLHFDDQTTTWGSMEQDITGPIAVAMAYFNMNGNNGQAACPLPDINGCDISAAAGTIAEIRTDSERSPHFRSVSS